MHQVFNQLPNSFNNDESKPLQIPSDRYHNTVYVSDLPKTTSYMDMSEIFEKKVGPCTITMKR
jgi:hypothetical protein